MKLKLLFLAFLSVVFTNVTAQTTLYTENFGTTSTLPTGWTSSNTTNGWANSTASSSTTYTGASGNSNVLFNGTGTNGLTHTLTYANSLSTVGYTTITVLWGARSTATFAASVVFEWSPDGVTWNPVSFTNVGATGNWALVNSGTRISLPSGAEGLSNLRFRWTSTATNSGNHRIDDFTVQGNAAGITSFQDGPWTTGSTWVGGVAPTSSQNVTIAHNVTSGAITRNSGTTTTINSGASLTVSGAYTNSGATTVNGTFQVDGGGYASGNAFSYAATGSTLIMNHNSGLYGISTGQAFWPTSNPPFNVTIQGTGAQINNTVGAVAGTLTVNSQLNCSTASALTVSGTALVNTQLNNATSGGLLINGTLQLNSSGYINSNAPTYGSASTLVYNTSYGVSTEWTGNATTAGTGIPQNVTVQNSAAVTLPNANRGLAGNLSINSGNVTLNASSGDLYVAGNWTRASGASFTPNNRAVFFNGSTTQNLTVSGGGTETFNYLQVNGSGTLKLATGTGLTVNSNGGLTLGSTNATSTIDLNGQTLTLSGGGNLSLSSGTRKITSTVAGGKVLVSSNALTITSGGALTTDTNTTVDLQNGLDCGTATLLTVLGTLQINANGYVFGNSPKYGAASLLQYNSGTNPYNRQLEWTSASGTIGTTVGFPNNVQISNNTTVNYINGANLGPKGINGNLTIDSGSSFYMDYGNTTSGGALTVAGNLVSAGTMTLGFVNGDDLKIAGNITFTSGYSFDPKGRAVFFTKNGTQILTASSTPTFHYLVFAPSSGNTTLQLSGGTSLNITAPNTGNVVIFSSSSDVFDLNGNTLALGTAGVANAISGSGTFKGSSASNLALLGSGSIGTLNFTASFQTLGTLAITRSNGAIAATLGTNLAISSAVQLNGGLLDLSASNLTLAAAATIATPSANAFIIADGTGELRKTFTAAGSFVFPVGDNTGTAEYSPATVTFTGGSYSSAYAAMRVTNAKHPSNVATTDYLTRYWSLTSSGIAPASYSFSGTYTAADVFGTEANCKPGRFDATDWQDISATSVSSNTLTLSGLTALSAVNQFSAGNPLTNSTYYYRSAVNNGLWATASNWEVSANNSTGWTIAVVAPSSNASGITIRSGFNINGSTSVSADDITIDSGATLTISGGTFTLNNGAAATDLTINGTLTYSGGTFTQNASAGIAVSATGTYNHSVSSATLTLPTATWNAASNCNVTGMTNSGPITGTNMGQAFGNFTWNNAAQGSYVNIESSAFSVAGTLTVGPTSNVNNKLSFGNSSGTFNNTVNTIVISGGQLNGIGNTGTENLTVTNGVSISGGIFAISDGSGTANVSIGTDLVISGTGNLTVLNNGSSPNTTVAVARDVTLSGTGSISLEAVSSAVATLNIGRDFNSTSTNTKSVDFGSGTATNNVINIARNFTKSGTGQFYTTATGAALGFAFNGSGTQILNYSGTTSNFTSYLVKSGATVQLASNLTLGINTNPASFFTVASGGILDFQTNSIIAGNTTDPQFFTASGAGLISANTSGLGGTTASGSLQSFGSVNTTAASGRATLVAGVNYTFNGATTTPFANGTFGNPATINVNANITSNMTSNLTVTTAVNVNNGGTFKLNTTNNNSLNLNAATLTVATGGTFDNGGTNQVLIGSGTPTINISGTFITRHPNGFVGSSTAIPSGVAIASPAMIPTLGSASTIEYALAGAQAVQGSTAPVYANITLSNGGTKTLASNNAATGTITISGSTIFDAGNNAFGSATSNVTMTGTSRYMLGGTTASKPESGGTYSLGAATTIEFTGSSATDIRVSSPVIDYANVVISGTNVSNPATVTGLKFQSGGTFTVNSGATFKLKNTAGFTGGTTTAINNTNSPTVTLASGSKVEYSGASQSITPFSTYYNMGISGTGTKTIPGSTEILVGNDLSVTASTLQIDGNKLLTVTNAINNSSGNNILVKNSGNLVQINDGVADTGNIKMTRTSRAMSQNDYIYWGQPVQGNVLSQIPGTYMASYMWDLYGTYDGLWNGITATVPGRGFITRVGGAGTGVQDFDFTGIPNNGVVTVAADSFDNGATLAATGNTVLLANPYPSALNATTFVNANTSSLEGTLYFWTSTTPITANAYNVNDYASWNQTGGTTTGGSALTPTGKIGAGQGFFALLNSDGGVTFNNSMRIRTTSDNSQFFRNADNGPVEPAYNRIWLNLTNADQAFRQILVGYLTGATNDFDSKFDGHSFTDNEINLYSILPQKTLVIQGRALPFDQNDQVPLGYKVTTPGLYTIAIAQTDGIFAGSQNIYLEDLLLGTIHDMKQSEYDFTSATGTFDNRFILRYTDTVLGTGFDTLENEVQVAAHGNQLQVKSDKEFIKKITIFDLAGRNVFESENLNTKRVEIKDFVLNQQALIVKITLANGQTATRKIVL